MPIKVKIPRLPDEDGYKEQTLPGRPDHTSESIEEPFEPPAPEQIWPPPPSEMSQLTLRGIEEADQVETEGQNDGHWESQSEQIEHSIDDIRRAALEGAVADHSETTSEYVYPRQFPETTSEKPLETPSQDSPEIEAVEPVDDEAHQGLRLHASHEPDTVFHEDEDLSASLMELPAPNPNQIDSMVAGRTANASVTADRSDAPSVPTAATCGIREESEGELARLWDNVFFSTERASPQSLIVTAVRRGDGATQIAASMALFGTKANPGLRILLVDSNLRQPALAKTLGIREQPGLTDILNGDAALDDALQSVQLDNGNPFCVLTSGTAADHPSGLIKSRQMQSLVGELRERFDHILFDVPSPDAYPDAQVVGPLTDGALLVLRGGSTPREAATNVKKRLALANVRCLGLVLNQHAEHALIA
ncbi:MAG: CpsD/CapB family tyrosine-protein kinase [Phycisphaerales bacterium]|nr:CpsD/CapB family tyrosine-protein kinase [Phycisphaerales bacterium]